MTVWQEEKAEGSRRTTCPCSEERGQWLQDLFIQFSGHVYAVTGEYGVTMMHLLPEPVQQFLRYASSVEAEAVTVCAAKEPKEAARAITATKVSCFS